VHVQAARVHLDADAGDALDADAHARQGRAVRGLPAHAELAGQPQARLGLHHERHRVGHAESAIGVRRERARLAQGPDAHGERGRGRGVAPERLDALAGRALHALAETAHARASRCIARAAM
jgi:hypothetical protein